MDGSLIGFLIGFNRRPPDARACGFGFPETPAVSPVTINRRLSDACLRGWPSREGVAELPESGKSIL